jgi:hypothetical protein
MFIEGLPDAEAQAYLMVDGSLTMQQSEMQTGEPKHRRCAWMVQEVLNGMDDPQYEFADITVGCFSADKTGIKMVSLLEEHNPYTLKTYTENQDLDYWDGLSPENRQRGMGRMTPIGAALAWARHKAEQWVTAADGQVQRRAVIYLLSDGMNTHGPDGKEEKQAIAAFNDSCEKGYIRLATIGYFQSAPGTNDEEDAGRQLLQELPFNRWGYFESNNVTEIVGYILSTLTQVTHHGEVAA